MGAGGYTEKVHARASGLTELYNITKGKDWEKSNPMKIPRKHHSCVSISTKKGERLLAVGGIDQNDETITTVELFNPITKSWEIDTKRSLPVGVINPAIVTIGCKVYLISK